jgi:hypothetical protein
VILPALDAEHARCTKRHDAQRQQVRHMSAVKQSKRRLAAAAVQDGDAPSLRIPLQAEGDVPPAFMLGQGRHATRTRRRSLPPPVVPFTD